MNIAVFLGPSLDLTKAKSIIDATFLPPVAQGDIINVLDSEPDVIVIVDGYFENIPSVWHKEILLALEKGILVYGASSMGALRASELHSFGMRGFGQVFEWYRDGIIEDDDEVAVIHAPAEFGYKSISVAMVDIRYSYQKAAREGIVTNEVANQLTGIAKSLFFPERNYNTIHALAEQQGILATDLSSMHDFIQHGPPGIKESDAIELLKALAAENTIDTHLYTTPRVNVEKTVFLQMLIMESVARNQHSNNNVNKVIQKKRTLMEWYQLLKSDKFYCLLIAQESDRLGIVVDDDKLQHKFDLFRLELGLQDSDKTFSWLGGQGMNLEILTGLLKYCCQAEMLEEFYELNMDNFLTSLAGV